MLWIWVFFLSLSCLAVYKYHSGGCVGGAWGSVFVFRGVFFSVFFLFSSAFTHAQSLAFLTD